MRLNSLKKELAKGFTAMHNAAATGQEVAVAIMGLEDLEGAELRHAFLGALEISGMTDVLANQIQYAVGLANCRRELLYEEMHKLYCLLDEIEALRSLGLAAERAAVETLDRAIRRRFEREPRKARIAAQQNMEDWNNAHWWYSYWGRDVNAAEQSVR